MEISKSHNNVVNLFHKSYAFGLNIFFSPLGLLSRFSLHFSSVSSSFTFPIFSFLSLRLYQVEMKIKFLCENNSIAEEERMIHFQMPEIVFMRPIPMFS